MDRPAASASTVAYLGPRGTFSEAALHTQADLVELNLEPMSTIPEVLSAVANGDVEFGFVPIENAIEGSVNVTIDTLAFDTELLIQREVTLAINLNLMARSDVSIESITRVASMPMATAQCRNFLRQKLPHARAEAANSTAEAAEAAARSETGQLAAIAPQRSAELYGLAILAADIGDHPDNKTRFVVVARGGIAPRTGHDKTSIVVFQRTDTPGSLLAILQEFAARSVNLTKLESRPTKESLGDYCFLIDLEGHIGDELVADALRSLHAKAGRVKFLGSYPAAGEHGPSKRRVASQRWDAARRWIEDLRDQIG